MEPIIIVGMHRSGTSALAGLLHHNGIIMGEEENLKPKPKKQNAKGFYENFRFRSLNDQLLGYNNYKVKSFDPYVPKFEFSDELKLEGLNLIKEYSTKYKNWGWKDPRTSLTLKFWLDICPNAKIVISRRDYEKIAQSMWARKNSGSVKKYIDLCTVYYEAIYTAAYNIDWCDVSFDNLCTHTDQEAYKLAGFLDHPITDLSFIEVGLRHHKEKNNETSKMDD
jgi:hypothetical protein